MIEKENGRERGIHRGRNPSGSKRQGFYFVFLIASLDHWTIIRFKYSLKRDVESRQLLVHSDLNATCLISGN